MSDQALLKLNIPGAHLFKTGKVREVYDLDERLLLVATDRISAFDCILPVGIPRKGEVLNRLSAWWFEQTRDIIPNHMISLDLDSLPDLFAPSQTMLEGRAMIARKTRALPVECVVRGYLIGSGWKDYQATGAVSGIPLREGYQLADPLDVPIFTPASKAESGHDENISYEEVVRQLGEQLARQLKETSLRLYRFAAEYARAKGIIIADTKFEFGLLDDQLILIDEALTPDSSRFWPADQYRAGISPPSYDKQYVRDYLERLDWDKTPPAPSLPNEVIEKTSAKYCQVFEKLTGESL